MKKKRNKEESVVVDLTDRKKIQIVNSNKKKVVSDEKMNDFESKIISRYNETAEFIELLLELNMKYNCTNMSEENFTETYKSIFEQNKILENMVEVKEVNKG